MYPIRTPRSFIRKKSPKSRLFVHVPQIDRKSIQMKTLF